MSRRGPGQANRSSIAALVLLVVAVLAFAGYAVKSSAGPRVVDAGSTPGYSVPVPTPAAVYFGDSFFNGANGVTPDQTFAALGLHELGYDASVGGHGGTGYAATDAGSKTPNYVDQIKSGALSTFDPTNVKLVVIDGGLNDESLDPGLIQTNAASTFASFKAYFPAAKIVVVGPLNPSGQPSDQEQRTNQAISDAAASAGLKFIDATGWYTTDNRSQILGTVDQTHPTVAGHKILEPMFVAALRAAGVVDAHGV